MEARPLTKKGPENMTWFLAEHDLSLLFFKYWAIDVDRDGKQDAVYFDADPSDKKPGELIGWPCGSRVYKKKNALRPYRNFSFWF